MNSDGQTSESNERIPRLDPEWDPTDCTLSPAEGFLLSRIDGKTSWTVLREMGGISPDEADRFLERWLAQGILMFEPLESEAPAAPDAAPPPAPEDFESCIDPDLDLTPELQRRILEFEANLDAPYHALLDVPRDADGRAIKRAYFRLSKEFHPDRYFRREIGTYQLRLERIFKKVVEAYELLSDPATREEIERSLAAAPPEDAPSAGAYRTDQVASERVGPEPRRKRGYKTPTKFENLERLRRRFQMPKKVLEERRFKARQFYQSSMVALHEKRWLEAAASMRLAIAFDPWNPEYKERFGDVLANVHKLRATQLLEEADTNAGGGGHEEALRLLEEALGYRPSDPEINRRAAEAALELGEMEKAREYADAASTFAPDDAANHALLARVLRRSGLKEKAREALDAALKIDRNHPDVQAEMRQLGRRRSR